MSTPEWIEYTGSDEQIEEMWNAEHGYAVISNGVIKTKKANQVWQSKDAFFVHAKSAVNRVTSYLICQPHPYADLIKIWADTGCPVWVRPTKPYEFKISDYENHPTTSLMVDGKGVYLITTKPDWNIPGAEYRLTPFED